MAKTIVAMLVGVALSERTIQSLDDPSAKYVAELTGTPYGQTPLRHLLTMSSGVQFAEGYTGNSGLATLFRLSALGESAGGAATVMPFRRERARVCGRVPYEVLVQGDAPRERLLERFRAEVDSVLLATATFWQGVDVPGESLSLLVIDKLPFSAPGDPLHEARCEAVEAGGGDWFRDFALPTAMLQLRQGFGRLIRGHADRGVVAILDPRLRTRAYGRAFLAALPHCPLVDDRAAVAAFFGAEAVATLPAAPGWRNW